MFLLDVSVLSLTPSPSSEDHRERKKQVHLLLGLGPESEYWAWYSVATVPPGGVRVALQASINPNCLDVLSK